jgi:hydrogenase expression/formation protein HypC
MCLGVPGKVVKKWEVGGAVMGVVDFAGIQKEVCLQYVPDIEVGEYTIVHVGFAITKLDEAAALESLELFKSLGVLDEELGADTTSGAGPPATP